MTRPPGPRRRVRAPARPAGAGGFTLIELLVGLALMGMAATLLLYGVQGVGAVALRERQGTTALEQVIAAQQLLRATIERLRPVSRTDSSIALVDLRGGADRFSFIGPSLDRDAPDALQRYRLLRTAEGDLALYSVSTRRIGVDKEGPTLAGWTRATLVPGIAGLSFAYFGVRGTADGGAPRWHDHWWDRPHPPELVRIRIAFPRGDRRHWPDLVIRPGATVNATCTGEGSFNRCVDGS